MTYLSQNNDNFCIMIFFVSLHINSKINIKNGTYDQRD